MGKSQNTTNELQSRLHPPEVTSGSAVTNFPLYRLSHPIIGNQPHFTVPGRLRRSAHTPVFTPYRRQKTFQRQPNFPPPRPFREHFPSGLYALESLVLRLCNLFRTVNPEPLRNLHNLASGTRKCKTQFVSGYGTADQKQRAKRVPKLRIRGGAVCSRADCAVRCSGRWSGEVVFARPAD